MRGASGDRRRGLGNSEAALAAGLLGRSMAALTPFIRDNTVLHHPAIGIKHEQKVLNPDVVIEQGIRFAHNALRVTTGRLVKSFSVGNSDHYCPVGYLISRKKFRENKATGRLQESRERRESSMRLQDQPDVSGNDEQTDE